jgi:hypothetical protein
MPMSRMVNLSAAVYPPFCLVLPDELVLLINRQRPSSEADDLQTVHSGRLRGMRVKWATAANTGTA